MPLLFKSKSQYISKKQTGGTIPFYSSYTVKMADSPLFNPGELLKAYSQRIPSGLEKKEIPEHVQKGLEITTKGKDNETFIAADKLGHMRNQIEDYYKAGVEPPEGLLNTFKGEQLGLNNSVLNGKTILDEASKNVNSTAQQAGSNLVYRDGKMLVKTFTVDGQGNRELKNEWMDAEEVKHLRTDPENRKEINSFNPKSVYKGKGFTFVAPLTHTEAISEANSSADPMFLFAEGQATAQSLATGLSSNKALGAIEDAFYKQLGEQFKENKVSNNDGTVLNASGEYEGDNAEALNNARALVVQSLDPIIKNALMPKAWEVDNITIDANGQAISVPTTTKAQAEQNLQRMLSFQANQKLRIKRKDTDLIAVKPDKAGSESDGGATYAEVPSYITDLTGTPVTLGIESLAIDPKSKLMVDNKNVWTTIQGRKAVSASQWLANKINDEKNSYAKTPDDDRADITAGVELKELAASIPGEKGDSPFTATSIQDAKFIDGKSIPESVRVKTIIKPDQAVNIYYMPVDGRTGKFITDSKFLSQPNVKSAIEKYKTEMEKVEKNARENPNSVSVSELTKQKASIKAELSTQLPNFELVPHYKVQGAAIFTSEEADEDKAPSETNFIDVLSKANVLSENIYNMIKKSLGQVGDASEETLSSDAGQTRVFDIFLPLEKTLEMWELQQPVKIEKSKTDIDFLNSISQNKPMQ
jgi:hypothetical protein